MKHYTFMELAVTVCTFSVLAALAVCASAGTKADAKSVRCQSYLKKFAAAAASYAANNNDFLPAGMTPSDRGTSMRWNNALQAELGTKFLRCPANTPKSTGYGANYCYNPKQNAKLPFYYYDPDNPEKSKLAKYSRQLPRIVLFGDAVSYTCVSPRQLGCRPVRDVSGDGVKDSARGADYNYWAPNRHNGNWNYAAADGSVHSISFNQWQSHMNNSGILYDSDYDF